MTGDQFAWVTHSPADYTLVFSKHLDGEHVVVSARFEDKDQAWDAARSLEGAQVDDTELHVYCTLPGEADTALAGVRTAPTHVSWVDSGTIAFVATGDGSATIRETVRRRENGPSLIVSSLGGNAPRCYRFDDQCTACGEFRGKINVLPGGGVCIDTRRLSCRCESIPCRYCQDGKVRRPLTEHFDPERLSLIHI